ncbi:MAG TPA: Bax inhibitor-1/YccA family protein [Flavisolibacter sp.]|jgi:uncharacterized YccA/Bax inhibitor family protein|nr:Bax inhibitor-1/YccA family protein [Flavisolibacter sp.]
MGLFKSSNPALNEKVFQSASVLAGEERMTITGAVKKFGIMLLMLVGAASFTWDQFYKGADVMPWAIGSAIGGLVLAIIIIFKKSWSPYLALGYAMFEGLFLGAVSAAFNAGFAAKYPGIIQQAVLLTFGVSAAMFALYYFRILKASPTFTRVVVGATAGIALFYLIDFVMHLFGVNMPYLHENGTVGVGISLFVVTVAAMNLILDFDMIEQGAAQGAPKYFEWYSAFGLMVTIVWLYMEILRLLSKLASRK